MSDPSFQQILSMFYKGEYERGKEQITNLIIKYPTNSMLHLNRALFLFQLGMDGEGIHDLQVCLKLNPRNHIAYFNLFSVQSRYEYY